MWNMNFLREGHENEGNSMLIVAIPSPRDIVLAVECKAGDTIGHIRSGGYEKYVHNLNRQALKKRQC
jgi:hypothetical protein